MIQTAESKEYAKEMNRRKMDSFEVYNPTDEDFPIVWDSTEIYLIPANSTKIVPRYIHDQYLRQMTDSLLTKKSKEEMSKLLSKKWIPHHERETIELRTDNEQERLEIYKVLSHGKKSDFGRDVQYISTNTKPVENKSLEERLLEALEHDTVLAPDTSEGDSLQAIKQEALKGVSK
jgi:hypothetical protein